MNLEFLLEEGERLARDMFVLGDQPNERGIVGYWGGERSDLPNSVPKWASMLKGRQHLFSFDQDLLNELEAKSRGPVAVFEYELADGGQQFRVEEKSDLPVKDIPCTGTPLYAEIATSYPPFPAICLYGSRRIEDWLQGLGLTRFDYWKLRESFIDDYYQNVFWPSCVLSMREAYLAVHPWACEWPDEEHYMIPPLDCLALTTRDAEPWYEVAYSEATFNYHVTGRIS